MWQVRSSHEVCLGLAGALLSYEDRLVLRLLAAEMAGLVDHVCPACARTHTPSPRRADHAHTRGGSPHHLHKEILFAHSIVDRGLSRAPCGRQIVFVESAVTHSGVPRELRFANSSRPDGAWLVALFAAHRIRATIRVHHDTRRHLPTHDAPMAMDYRARAGLPHAFAALGMASHDVGIVHDGDETFVRAYLAALRVCDVPALRPATRHMPPELASCESVKLAGRALVFEGGFDCVSKARVSRAEWWHHPDAIPGRCLEGVGVEAGGGTGARIGGGVHAEPLRNGSHQYDRDGMLVINDSQFGGANWVRAPNNRTWVCDVECCGC